MTLNNHSIGMIGAGGERILALGIDAGGSYTDAVVMDVRTKEIIAKMKSRTTHDDMIVGMRNAMNGLILKRSFNPKDIKYVGLSTTLATNSILESKGGKVGLITIGWTPEREALMEPLKEFFVAGGHDVKGKSISGLDESALIDAAKELEKVADNIVLSAKFSCIYDSHERRAKQILADKVGIPVIATYELSRDIGVYERANTAILNGMLLPVINDFIMGVLSLLSRYGVDAHVMMMKGDGTMMRIETARLRPVETIMSGPAASIVGGLALSGCSDGIVIDIGSTSTDVACIRDGMPPLSKKGVTVLGKGTHVRTIDAHTIALGGDSHISVTADGEVALGPRRSAPLAMSSAAYPSLKKRMKSDGDVTYLIPHKDRTRTLTPSETKVLSYVKDNAPCRVSDITAEYPLMYTLPSVIDSLLAAGSVIFTSLTPTDLMVAAGRFETGDREASEIGLDIFSRNTGITDEQLILKVMDRAVMSAGSAILEKIMADETGSKDIDKVSRRLIDASVGKDRFTAIDTNFRLRLPIIGLGGPAAAYLTSLRNRLDAEVVIPENHDIGNAVGTLRSRVSETSYATLIPSKEGGYEIRSSFSQMIKAMRFDDAVRQAVEMTSSDAVGNIRKQGGIDINVHTETENADPKEFDDIENVVRVSARATGDLMEHIVGFRYV
ncbi:MAG: hydantoinase/oxoprolinase family protein [Methanomassiliicoccaceae archaeon]|nr:hydantoinase/oxoprolinase family protein [Methanomassiliicoccaceae archaeon]